LSSFFLNCLINKKEKMDEFASRVGLYAVGKVVWPAAFWIGRKVLSGPITPERGVLLGGAGFITTVVISLQPERSLDFVLRSLSFVANTTAAIMSLIANKLRMLEKADLEALVNAPLQYLPDWNSREESKKRESNAGNRCSTSSFAKGLQG
jgi:hypothetical protein